MAPESHPSPASAALALAEAQRFFEVSDHVRGAEAARAAWELAVHEGAPSAQANRAATLLLMHLQRSGDDEQALIQGQRALAGR